MSQNERLFGSIFPERLSKGDRKKLEIVEAAVRVFAKDGAEALTYDRLGTELETTRSHIRYHFQDRQDIVVGVIRYMMSLGHEFTFENLRKAESPIERISAYLDGYYDFFVKNPQYGPIMLHFYYLSGYAGDLRDLQSQVRQQAFERIEELLLQAYIEAGKRKPQDLETIVDQVQRLILGGLILSLSTGDILSKSEAQKVKARVLQTIMTLSRLKG